ncbi:MAG: J domain-containing protein [Clostridia bacterium]|nr:J domain-containing protein [Clostridia bacterium]
MIFKDYYKILELETSHVTLEEIKLAYRNQAKKYHPDVNVGDRLAEERIKDINEAYRTLSIPAQKRKYDRIWNSHVGRTKNSAGKVEKKYIFNMFLGNVDNKIENKKTNIQVKGENIETQIDCTLEDAFLGKKKTLVLKNAEGKDKTIDFQIPEGIRNGEKIRLIGQGKSGKNGGKNGDLLIKINMKDNSIFKLKGYDLYTNLYLTPWEAALGSKIKIKTMEDEAEIFIPEGTQTGENIKIQNKGYKKGQGERGDLYATVKVMTPKELSPEEKKAYEKLKNISKFNPRKEIK